MIRAFITAGYNPLGFDVDNAKIDKLEQGESYIGHIDSAWGKSCVDAKSFQPTSDPARLAEADVLLICVPTPLTASGNPDLSYVESADRQVIASWATDRPGKSNLPRSLPRNRSADVRASGLTVGEDCFLAYRPEREDSGNPDYTASGIPKVVSGFDEASTRLAKACKILENTYRSVNIALPLTY